jgi:uncharacterized protein (DUF1684 family)
MDYRAGDKSVQSTSMRVFSTVLIVAVFVSAAAGCRRGPGDASALPDPETGNAAAAAWQAKHESDYRREWVTIAGLHALKPGINSAGSETTNDIVLPPSTPSVVGQFTLDGTRVQFEPSPDVRVLLKDQPITNAVTLRDDSEPEADELIVGDVRIVVHVSGDARAIRVRDPNGPLARGFLGFTWFPVDAQYRVVGRLRRDSVPQRFKVLNTYGDQDEYNTEGIVEFQLLGQKLRLRPFTTRPNRFYFVFRDASSGQETYETARFLYSDLRPDDTTVLDFNMAYNPPCAFNPYTTCPIPLRENRLPVKVLAGEKAYPAPVAPLTGPSR